MNNINSFSSAKVNSKVVSTPDNVTNTIGKEYLKILDPDYTEKWKYSRAKTNHLSMRDNRNAQTQRVAVPNQNQLGIPLQGHSLQKNNETIKQRITNKRFKHFINQDILEVGVDDNIVRTSKATDPLEVCEVMSN